MAKVSADLEILTLEVAPLCKAELKSMSVCTVYIVQLFSLIAMLNRSTSSCYFMFCIIKYPPYYVLGDCMFIPQTLRLKLGWTALKLKSVLGK